MSRECTSNLITFYGSKIIVLKNYPVCLVFGGKKKRNKSYLNQMLCSYRPGIVTVDDIRRVQKRLLWLYIHDINNLAQLVAKWGA